MEMGESPLISEVADTMFTLKICIALGRATATVNRNTENEIHKLWEYYDLHFQIIGKYNQFYITLEDKTSFRIYPYIIS